MFSSSQAKSWSDARKEYYYLLWLARSTKSEFRAERLSKHIIEMNKYPPVATIACRYARYCALLAVPYISKGNN